MRRGFWGSERGCRELEELAARFPSLRFELQDDGSALLSGTFDVAPDVGYTTKLEIPKRYPHEIPVLHCDPAEIPWKLDRHVITTTGHGCLCARGEYRLHWPENCSLGDFIDRLVRPFFVGQFYYDTHGCWPLSGERSHGWKGIVEAYTELCAPFGDASPDTILRLMRLLSRKHAPQGHEPCPCGNNRKLRHCHREVVAKLRKSVRREDAAADLTHLLHFKFGQPSD